MKKLFILLIVCVATLTTQAQVLRCYHAINYSTWNINKVTLESMVINSVVYKINIDVLEGTTQVPIDYNTVSESIQQHILAATDSCVSVNYDIHVDAVFSKGITRNTRIWSYICIDDAECLVSEFRYVIYANLSPSFTITKTVADTTVADTSPCLPWTHPGEIAGTWESQDTLCLTSVSVPPS